MLLLITSKQYEYSPDKFENVMQSPDFSSLHVCTKSSYFVSYRFKVKLDHVPSIYLTDSFPDVGRIAKLVFIDFFCLRQTR